jgi:hypothetical protein
MLGPAMALAWCVGKGGRMRTVSVSVILALLALDRDLLLLNQTPLFFKLLVDPTLNHSFSP